MHKDEWLTDDGIQPDRAGDLVIGVMLSISPPNLSRQDVFDTRWDAPSVPEKVPLPAIPRGVLCTSYNTQRVKASDRNQPW